MLEWASCILFCRLIKYLYKGLAHVQALFYLRPLMFNDFLVSFRAGAKQKIK